MEYPGRADRIWEVRVFDSKGNGIYYEKNLSRKEAEKVADRYYARDDVSRIVCCEEGYKDAGDE